MDSNRFDEWDLTERDLARYMGEVAVDDLPHACHVAHLARELFHVTWALHGFGPREMEIVQRAALMHDAGILISYRGHHKESQRIILAATFEGIDLEAQREIACVARYHRRALPRKHHEIFRELPHEARQRVAQLGGILRLADGFDYAHDGGVTHLHGHVLSASDRPATVTVRAMHRIQDPHTLERVVQRAAEKRDLFEHAFHCHVEIVTEPEPASASANGHAPHSVAQLQG
jgi:exopolyphosphatase/pppGpp-phosphohydrolase